MGDLTALATSGSAFGIDDPVAMWHARRYPALDPCKGRFAGEPACLRWLFRTKEMRAAGAIGCSYTVNRLQVLRRGEGLRPRTLEALVPLAVPDLDDSHDLQQVVYVLVMLLSEMKMPPHPLFEAR